MPHKLGQVFLKDPHILKKIVDQSFLDDKSIVLEIGCGDGDLSCVLAPKVKHLYIVELDTHCIEKTKERLASFSNVSFIHEDILRVDCSQFPSPLIVIANIPYYISAKIMKWCIANKQYLNKCVLMVQKEFCEKLVALPGQALYSSLGVYVSAFFSVKKLFNVSRQCFRPIPKVDSSVMLVVPSNAYAYPADSRLFDMIRTGFWGRRKPFKSALKKSPYGTFSFLDSCPENIQELIKKRAEKLSLDEFILVYKSLQC
jgi:16S rRNA (adenine1518-N6/adenine1519-N6)-dimethyltransferase